MRDSNLGTAAISQLEAVFRAAKWTEVPDTVKPDKDGPFALDAPFVRITRNAAGDADKSLNYNLGCEAKAPHALFEALLAVMPRPTAGAQSREAS